MIQTDILWCTPIKSNGSETTSLKPEKQKSGRGSAMYQSSECVHGVPKGDVDEWGTLAARDRSKVSESEGSE